MKIYTSLRREERGEEDPFIRIKNLGSVRVNRRREPRARIKTGIKINLVEGMLRSQARQGSARLSYLAENFAH